VNAPTAAAIIAAANADDETYESYVRRSGRAPRGLLTLADVAARTLAGEDFFFCVREFLAGLPLLDVADRVPLVEERPSDLDDDVAQAYLGALAEHVSAAADRAAPGWALEADRFLSRFWFGTDRRGLEAWCLVESPASFRRRGLFITRGRLRRI
jgi:hypothetical protein